MTFTLNVAPSHFKNEEGFWRDIDETFEQLESFLTATIESRVQAENNTYGSGLGHNANKLFPMVVTYRQTDNREQLEYFHMSGYNLLDTVRKHIAKKEITHEFLMDWAQISFCAGFVANNMYAMGNDLNDIRAGIKGGEAVSVDDKRVWFAKMYMREFNDPKYRSRRHGRKKNRANIEDSLTNFIFDVIEDKNRLIKKYPKLPLCWFEGFLNKGGLLKSTYRQKELPFKIIRDDYSQRSIEGLPPINLKIPIP